jgi:hypothetical protein
MPLYYEDSGQDPDKVEFAKQVFEYQEDMDFLSDNFYSHDRAFLEKHGFWDEYLWHEAFNAKPEIREVRPDFAEALDSLIDFRKMKRGMGWFSSAEVEQIDPDGFHGLAMFNQVASNPESTDRQMAYEITDKMLKWGYLDITRLPEALKTALWDTHHQRTQVAIEATLPGQQ